MKNNLYQTCLCKVLIKPNVKPESVFWVATGISKLSLTGGISPLAKQRKYLKYNINNVYYLIKSNLKRI